MKSTKKKGRYMDATEDKTPGLYVQKRDRWGGRPIQERHAQRGG